MVLDLRKVFNGEKKKIPFSVTLDWSEESYNGCKPFAAPVEVSGIASNTSEIVLLQYRAVTLLKMPCDRCANETEQEFAKDFEHVLVSYLDGEDNGEVLEIGNKLQLDIDELVRDDMLLEFPTKFLCKEDCKGLCFICGANLNDGDCGCNKAKTDPRWEVLNDLLS